MSFNRLVGALLSSRAHGLLSNRILLLTVRGAKTGRAYTFPVQFVSFDEGFIIAVGKGKTKTWWRNIWSRPDVSIVYRSKTLEATAELLFGFTDPDRAGEALGRYLRRFPTALKSLGVDPRDQLFVVVRPALRLPSAAVASNALAGVLEPVAG